MSGGSDSDNISDFLKNIMDNKDMMNVSSEEMMSGGAKKKKSVSKKKKDKYI